MHRLFAAIALVIATTQVRSQHNDPGDTIIVTATRTEIRLADATVPVDVITRQDIELSAASDLAELLRFEAGIDIGRNGGPGQATSVFLRGTESNHTLILVDGVRVNPGTLGGAAVQNIAPEMIERVEIVKGTRSALFGTDAIGGVINIITRRNRTAWGEASVGSGSFNSHSGFFAAGANNDNGEYGISLNHSDTDGFPARTDSTLDRGYDNTSVNAHAGRRIGSSFISLRHWSASGTSEYLDFFSSPLDQDFNNRATALEVRSVFGDTTSSKLVIARMTDDISQNQSADFVESTRVSVDWQLSQVIGNHVLGAGVYWFDENAASISFGSGFDRDTESKAVFVQDQWSYGRHQAFLAVRLTDHETFGNETTWNAEYAIALHDDWTMLAGLGHAFRAPDATDRFGFGGNANLAPEVADEVQLGLRYAAGAGNTFKLELYRNDIDDLIEFDLGTFELRNIAAAEIRGAELSWDFQNDDFSIRTSIVRQSAENPLDDVRLLRRAEKRVTVNLVRHFGDHRLGMSILASGDREDFGATKLPGYALVNLTGQLAIGDRWRVNAKVENLFDRQYETAAGFRMQELSAFLELRYAWR